MWCRALGRGHPASPASAASLPAPPEPAVVVALVALASSLHFLVSSSPQGNPLACHCKVARSCRRSPIPCPAGKPFGDTNAGLICWPRGDCAADWRCHGRRPGSRVGVAGSSPRGESGPLGHRASAAPPSVPGHVPGHLADLCLFYHFPRYFV